MAEKVTDERLGRGVAGGEAHQAAGALQTGDYLLDAVSLLQQPPRLLVERPSRGSELDALRRAFEQLDPRGRLQMSESLGERGLRDVQRSGGASEAAELGGRAERSQLIYGRASQAR
jgi:hypothetical protein